MTRLTEFRPTRNTTIAGAATGQKLSAGFLRPSQNAVPSAVPLQRCRTLPLRSALSAPDSQGTSTAEPPCQFHAATLIPLRAVMWGAKSVPSHRPPYDDNHHISGYNLFVSAYHGFAQLGREHVPVPQPYPLFPISHLQLLQIDSASSSGSVSLRYHLTLQNTDNPARWHVSAKIQLTAPGMGCDPGMMRTYMGVRNHQNEIVFNVPCPDIEDYQVHLRYRLIDDMTGYRNNWRLFN